MEEQEYANNMLSLELRIEEQRRTIVSLESRLKSAEAQTSYYRNLLTEAKSQTDEGLRKKADLNRGLYHAALRRIQTARRVLRGSASEYELRQIENAPPIAKAEQQPASEERR